MEVQQPQCHSLSLRPLTKLNKVINPGFVVDCSSDSETDSDIRTEREKDIELASSHSSDDDEPIPPVTLSSIKPIVVNTQQG